MSKTPFMPLWVSDFLGDTLDLDATEVGAYLLLLMAQWQRGGASLPDDEKKLQRVARCGRNWAKVWGAIGHYFDRDEDGVFNKRLRFEAQNVAAKRDVNAQNGARGGSAKALKNKNACVANASNSLQRNASIPEPEPEPEREDGGGGSACAREADLTDREMILDAMGVDPSGMIGPSKFVGTQADMAELARWLDLPGLTMPVVVEEIRRVCASKADGPPSRWSYFSPIMARLSAALTAPPLQPDARASPPARSTGPDLAAAIARLEAQGRA